MKCPSLVSISSVKRVAVGCILAYAVKSITGKCINPTQAKKNTCVIITLVLHEKQKATKARLLTFKKDTPSSPHLLVLQGYSPYGTYLLY